MHLLDAATVRTDLPRETRELVARETRDAWLVLLNRCKLAGPSQRKAARACLEQQAKDTSFHETQAAEIPLTLIEGPELRALPDDPPVAVPGFESLSGNFPGRLHRGALVALMAGGATRTRPAVRSS